MYGFGDDRNPANDTVNVLEEILVEYIVDVVRVPFYLPKQEIWLNYLILCCSVRRPLALVKRHGCRLKTSEGLCHDLLMLRSSPVWKSFYSCRKTSSVLVPNSRKRI